MNFRRLLRISLIAFLTVLAAQAAHAQYGTCVEPWLNTYFPAALHRDPIGGGRSGECNIQLYGGGHWGDSNDLTQLIVHSKDCADPWIGEAYYELPNLRRTPTATECNAKNYGGGTWTTFPDLEGKVGDYQAAIRLSGSQMLVASNGALLNNQGAIVNANAIANIWLQVVSNDGGSLVGPSGGTLTQAQYGAIVNKIAGLSAAQKQSIILSGGGTLTAAQRQNIILSGGGTLTAAEKSTFVGHNGWALVSNASGTLQAPAVGMILNLSTNGAHFYSLASAGSKQVLGVTSIGHR